MAANVVVLGVSGSIAAYKALEVASALTQHGCDVRVIMTDAARRFIRPLSFESITHNSVLSDLWSEQQDTDISHIRIAHAASLVAIVPATAHVIASMAHGLAGDALTATVLATRAPVIVCPAMNTDMWQHPATQENVASLRGRGVQFIGPATGNLAEGIQGEGRLADPAVIVDSILLALSTAADFTGRHVVVTAGPTYEAIDPVRFIGNRSSGKMGYALARAAANRGARVTLVTGPSTLPIPQFAAVVRVRTAQEMFDAVQSAVTPDCVLIMAAAVADYRPETVAPAKVKRSGASLTLRLTPTVDVLASLDRPTGMLVVAFAAETNDLNHHAAAKLVSKRADLLVANDVGEQGAGFETDTNHVWIFRPDASAVEVPRALKERISHAILDAVTRIPSFSLPLPSS